MKRRHGMLRTSLTALVVAGVTALIGFGGVELYLFLTQGSYFRIDRIEIGGLVRAGEQAVRSRAGVARGDNLITVNGNEVRDRLELDPWIRTARTVKELPDVLHIEVVEREPVAVVVTSPGGQPLGLDAECHILPGLRPDDLHSLGGGAEVGLPVLTGVGTHLFPGQVLGSEAQLALSLILAVQDSESLRGWISEVNFSRRLGCVAYPVDVAEQVFFGRRNLAGRVSNLVQVWPFLKENGIRCDYVDLRFEAQGVVIRPKEMRDSQWLSYLDERNPRMAAGRPTEERNTDLRKRG